MNFRPGEIVELRGEKFKVVATNYEGKLILHPFYEGSRAKESISDMTLRLQSTTSDPTAVRVPVIDSPPPPSGATP